MGAGSSIGWRESLGALVNLLEVKGAAASLEKIQNFSVSGANCGEGVGKSKARAIEVMTLLGPWFRLGSFPDAFVRRRSHYHPRSDELTRLLRYSHRLRRTTSRILLKCRGRISNQPTPTFVVLYKVSRSAPSLDSSQQ